MKTKIVEGCLIRGFKFQEFEGMVHCANCFCTFGPSVAKHIKENFPEAYEADCRTAKGLETKLGTFSYARVPSGHIFNLYGQYDFAHRNQPRQQYLDYTAFQQGLENIKLFCTLSNIKSLGMPYKIGSDRAGGDWTIVQRIIKEVFQYTDIEIKFYKLTN